jgi:hypothetical protein
VGTGFRKRSCSNKKLEPVTDSTKNHKALVAEARLRLGQIERLLTLDHRAPILPCSPLRFISSLRSVIISWVKTAVTPIANGTTASTLRHIIDRLPLGMTLPSFNVFLC